MKKALVQATAMTFSICGSAYAEESTVYGVIDTGLVADKIDGRATRTAVDGNQYLPSRWGIRGREDLAQDLQAVFVLENGFVGDTGAVLNGGRLFGRQAYVALNSRKWGELRLGRTDNLGLRWIATLASPAALGFGQMSVGTTFSLNDDVFGGGRVDNSVYYTSPSINGVVLSAGYSFNTGANLPGASISTEQPGPRNNNRMLDTGVRYDAGPLSVAFQYARAYVADSATNQRDPASLVAVFTYDFGAVKLYAGYDRQRNAQTPPSGSAVSSTGWLTANRFDDDAYSIGASVPLGPGAFLLSYQKLTSSKIDALGGGYVYALSKRTSLYAFANHGRTRVFTNDTDLARRQAGLGITHRF